MENLSVTIRIPALSGEFNFIIPSNMTTRNAIGLILKILNSEYNTPLANTNILLYDETDGKALNYNRSLYESGITDGSKLVLV